MDAFARGLDELGTFPDRARIEALGWLAEDVALAPPGPHGEDPVAEAALLLLGRLSSAPPPRIVPLLYTLDYIVKKLGERWQRAVEPYLIDTFLQLHDHMAPQDRVRLRNTLGTWRQMSVLPHVAEDMLARLTPQVHGGYAPFPGQYGSMDGMAGMKRPRMPDEPAAYPAYAATHMHTQAHGYAGAPPPSMWPGAPPVNGQMMPAPVGYGTAPGWAPIPVATAAPPPGPFAHTHTHTQPTGATALQSLLKTFKAGGPARAPARVIHPPLQPDEQDPYLSDLSRDVLSRPDARPVRCMLDWQPHRCDGCGARFPDAAEMQAHAATHAANDAKSSGVKCRGWFLPQDKWVTAAADGKGAPASDTVTFDLFAPAAGAQEEDADSVGMSSSDSESELVVPADDSTATCAACGEPFQRKWNSATETWVYVGAVMVDGEAYHAACASSTKVPVVTSRPVRE